MHHTVLCHYQVKRVSDTFFFRQNNNDNCTCSKPDGYCVLYMWTVTTCWCCGFQSWWIGFDGMKLCTRVPKTRRLCVRSYQSLKLNPQRLTPSVMILSINLCTWISSSLVLLAYPLVSLCHCSSTTSDSGFS